MLSKVINSDLCAGCGLCQSVFNDKITIDFNTKGFYRPSELTKLNRSEYMIFKEFCPGISVRKSRQKTPKYDKIWGEMYACSIGASYDNDVRKDASSGGAISMILIYLLEQQLIECVVHVGAAKGKPYLNEVKISTSTQQILENANSRYSPSSPLAHIMQIVANFNKVAFVGKPCDVAALKQYAKFNLQISEKIKYYISFFCAGVPSIAATVDLIKALDVEVDDVVKLDYRKGGWPGFFRIIDKHENVHKLSYALTWMKVLGPSVQLRCKVCPDAVGHFADIVCADSWDDFDDKGFPSFKSSLGKSLIIGRTELGYKTLNKAIEEGYLQKFQDIEDFRMIDKMQPGQMYKKQFHFARKMAVFFKTNIIIKSNVEFYYKATFTKSLISQLINFVGALKRI